MVDPISMGITVISHKFSSRAIKPIKMFCLKLLKIYLNTVPETVVLGIQGYIFIEFVYNKLVDQVMVSYFNVESLSEESFLISSFGVMRFRENA